MSNRRIRLIAICLLFISVAFSKSVFAFPCAETDQSCLIDLLRYGKSSQQLKAALLLSRFSNAETAQALGSLLESDDQMAATASLHSLIKIGLPAAAVLVESSRDSRPHIRAYAIYGLAKIGKGYEVKDLQELVNDSSSNVRVHLAAALEALADPECFKPLKELSIDNVINIRARAIKALGAVDHPQALATISFAMHDIYPAVGNQAIEAMIAKGSTALPELLRIAGSGKDFAKIRACIALAWIGDPAANPTLIRLLDSADSRVVRAAIYALMTTGDKMAIRPLRFLRNPQRQIDGVALGELAKQAIAKIEIRHKPKSRWDFTP